MRGVPSRVLPPARLRALLGAPGLTIGVFSLLSLGFGLYVLALEYNRLRVSGRAALRPALASWARATPVHYLGWTLADYADSWRRSSEKGRPERLAELRRALNTLGGALANPRGRSPLVNIRGLDLTPVGQSTIASWRSEGSAAAERSDWSDTFPLLASSGRRPAINLTVRYRLAPEVEGAVRGLETSYRRLLLALVGLSGYSLLCLGAMVLHVRSLRESVARESAQEATLDLADRTCHELGNVAFVLANEGRNLVDHLDLVDRFIRESRPALEAAARRAGLDDGQMERLRHHLKKQYSDRGLDPETELRGNAAIARDVCRQVSVCSDYIALTVRELDAYLKQSTLPIVPARVDLSRCLDDALALLAPAIEASGGRVDRGDSGLSARGDRRLLLHALVNLIKNALEAGSGRDVTPVVTVRAQAFGSVVAIRIADNGPGIPPADRPRVFEFGYSTKSTGRGRGLAIARESIEAQNGTIRVDGSHEGGACFVIELPTWEESSSEATESGPAAE